MVHDADQQRLVDGRCEEVAPGQEGLGAIRAEAQGHARHLEDVGLLHDAAGVGHDDRAHRHCGDHVEVAVPHGCGDQRVAIARLELIEPLASTEVVDGRLRAEEPDEENVVALLEQRLHRVHQQVEALAVGGVLAAVHAEAEERAVAHRRELLEHLVLVTARDGLLERVDDGVADHVDGGGREAFVDEELAVELDGGGVQVGAGIRNAGVELLRRGLLAALGPAVAVDRLLAERRPVEVGALLDPAAQHLRLGREGAQPGLDVDEGLPLTEGGQRAGHGGGGVAVHVGDREAAALGEPPQVERELGGDAGDEVVDASAHLEVDVLAHTELVEHRLRQVVVVVLTGVAQHHVVAAVAQLVIDRRLLDDVGLGADDDDVLAVLVRHGFLRVRCGLGAWVRGDLRGCWPRGANAGAPGWGCPWPASCPGRRPRPRG